MEQTGNVYVRFLGAAGTVTGSKYLIETPRKRLLIDCGLFQGLKELRELNWQPLPVDASTIDAVLLTHGHLDHVGHLPLLVKQGFSGPVYATQPTVEIARLILLDSARIQEEDAEHANRYGYSKHHPARPLYTVLEAEAVSPLFRKKATDEWIVLDDTIRFRFRYNGHILGATFIELEIGGRMLVFSGDIGRPEDPLLFAPQRPERADFLFIESTYGGKTHHSDPKSQLADAINDAAGKNGTILIPSFAVERTQLLMYYIQELLQEKAIPQLPVYMDSPMGAHVLDIFRNNPSWHKLSEEASDRITRQIRLVKDPLETLKLAKNRSPKIVIAASGMATGGRILSYFDYFLGDPQATVLFAGYQGEGTRGRALLDGAKEIKMHGKYRKVRAGVALIEGLSAHADQTELIGWMNALRPLPEKTFIVHGEPESSLALKKKIFQVYGAESVIAQKNMRVQLF